jgi:hypothetical protein
MKKINNLLVANDFINLIKDNKILPVNLLGSLVPDEIYKRVVPEKYGFYIISKDGTKIHSQLYKTQEECFFAAYDTVAEYGKNNIKLLTLKTYNNEGQS